MLFRLKSLDEDTNIETHWTVGEEETENLGGIQTRADLPGENIHTNALQFVFKQEGKRLYNLTKTRALRLCSKTNRCVWTKDLKQASEFNFVLHQPALETSDDDKKIGKKNLEKEEDENKEKNKTRVYLVAEKDRLVLHKNGLFAPYHDLSQHLTFTKEDVQLLKPSSSVVNKAQQADDEVAADSDEDDRWGNWIYVLLVFFLVLLVYCIYLLDLATCVFSDCYRPKIDPALPAELSGCS